MASFLRGVREYITPVLQQSAFRERGVLTPQEFVAAGDQLVFRFPTWSWEAGDPSKSKSYLPPDKQYLVTRNVPCNRRANVFEKEYVEETEVEKEVEGEESGWLATHVAGSEGGSGGGGLNKDYVEDLETIESDAYPSMGGGGRSLIGTAVVDEHFAVVKKDGSGVEVEEEYDDMATFEEDNVVQNDEATLEQPPYLTAVEPGEEGLGGASALPRTYDISITYDKYYQTPRAWLFGYNQDRQPLTPEEIFEDIMQDYVNRTVTMEDHPHLKGVRHASIHPCQHAAVMKRIVENLSEGGNIPRIDQYLIIFLKFVQSVIPTMEYDFTMEVQAGS